MGKELYQGYHEPLRLTPYGDGLAENGFSDPISGKFNLPEMGSPTPYGKFPK